MIRKLLLFVNVSPRRNNETPTVRMINGWMTIIHPVVVSIIKIMTEMMEFLLSILDFGIIHDVKEGSFEFGRYLR